MVQTKIGISGQESASSKLPDAVARAGSAGTAGNPEKKNNRFKKQNFIPVSQQFSKPEKASNFDRDD
jgi:hypothetical protein